MGYSVNGAEDAKPASADGPVYGEGFAAVYGSSRYAVFSQRLARLAVSLLAQHGVSGGALLDLACGAGVGSLVFAQAGYSVSAADVSPVMVRHTEARMAAQGLQSRVYLQDMRALALTYQVDVVACLFDALNYLLDDDELAQVFCRVGQALRPGGLFVFDMNTPQGLATRWGTKDVVSTNRAGLFEVNQNRYDSETNINTTTTTIFVREGGSDHYRRYTEVHRERGYATETVVALLTQAGFEIAALHALPDMYEGLAGGLAPLTQDARRIVIAARHVSP